ncbi:hypothetical protein CIG75_07310 [Tumebacillus algifaecis]|uniref:HNH domain-containing protein n=1 Tax=Tumebacillus algifaecis TaxID=1214604 RepID=A0A223D097_9BACL|nr:HNH endonuclease [Tumebacillus algifaecis]ASS74804.1 hypothetical protein CIG75_07310 [Tumebacillus algifaecis]
MVVENKSKRNPPWQRDEVILALDLYFRRHPKFLKQSDPLVVELSQLLNNLPIHKERSATFRNPSSVLKKLWNFAQYDPTYHGVGLMRGARMDKTIWDEFAGDLEYLQCVAQRIKEGADLELSSDAGDDEETEFPEGRVLYRLHKSRERNGRLIELAKKRAKDEGRLFCAICEFDFAKAYGPLGEGYIECHHTVPVSKYDENSKTRLEDLALVCSNCHRMLHRKRPWLNLTDLKGIYLRDERLR